MPLQNSTFVILITFGMIIIFVKLITLVTFITLVKVINYTLNYRSKITSIESAGRVVAADKARLTPSSLKTTQNRFIKILPFP